ncbi:MAG: hypothetical protein ACR2K9_05470 [Solirubrobacteraceae bacterium]
MKHVPTWPIAAGGLVLGFAVASATGVRAIGAVPLVAAGAWCAVRWWSRGGGRLAAELLGVYVLGFAASHVLAKVIGAWPSVAVVSAAVAVLVGLRADRFSPRFPVGSARG